VKRGKEISENRYKILDIENNNMIDKLHKYLIKWVNENPFLSVYIGTVKGIIIGILICMIFN
jgi:ElaB/YqjD/DUF883 family membrane-anchored ribosome-binding protein